MATLLGRSLGWFLGRIARLGRSVSCRSLGAGSGLRFGPDRRRGGGTRRSGLHGRCGSARSVVCPTEYLVLAGSSGCPSFGLADRSFDAASFRADRRRRHHLRYGRLAVSRAILERASERWRPSPAGGIRSANRTDIPRVAKSPRLVGGSHHDPGRPVRSATAHLPRSTASSLASWGTGFAPADLRTRGRPCRKKPHFQTSFLSRSG